MRYRLSLVLSLILLLGGLATSVWLVQQETTVLPHAQEERQRVTPTPTSYPDLNSDGIVDDEDLKLWLRYYEAGDPRADLNHDGQINVLEDLDIIRRALKINN